LITYHRKFTVYYQIHQQVVSGNEFSIGGCPRIASSRGRTKISRARRQGQKHRKRSCAYGEEVLVLLTQYVEFAAAHSRRVFSDSLLVGEGEGIENGYILTGTRLQQAIDRIKNVFANGGISYLKDFLFLFVPLLLLSSRPRLRSGRNHLFSPSRKRYNRGH